jgi:hypothetical protein
MASMEEIDPAFCGVMKIGTSNTDEEHDRINRKDFSKRQLLTNTVWVMARSNGKGDMCLLRRAPYLFPVPIKHSNLLLVPVRSTPLFFRRVVRLSLIVLSIINVMLWAGLCANSSACE